MEAIINHIRGDKLKATECIFCDKHENIKIFGIIVEEKFDGHLFKMFGVCPEHLDKINALLSGEYDIDSILLEKYRKITTRSITANLRR